MATQVETKVQASTAAAAASGIMLWIMGRYVFKGGVPDVVASWTYVLVPGILTFGAGYLARHTPRPDEPAGNMPADIPARGGYSAGRRTASELPPPPPSMTMMQPVTFDDSPPEKTLAPPAAPE